jgi:hypothetical protein
MAWSNLRTDAVLEIAVMMFQVFGVAMLCLTRLMPATRWAEKGRVGFVLAMIGLGIAGAWVGRHDSEFALFAGGTMTFLLIGMIAGNSTTDAAIPVGVRLKAESSLIG